MSENTKRAGVSAPPLPHQPEPKIVVRRRTKQNTPLRKMVAQLRRLDPRLGDPRYAFIVKSFARMVLLNDRAFETVRDMSLLDAEGELRRSVDTVRRLAETESRLAEKLGLTPSSEKPLPAIDIEAVNRRIEKIIAQRTARGRLIK